MPRQKTAAFQPGRRFVPWVNLFIEGSFVCCDYNIQCPAVPVPSQQRRNGAVYLLEHGRKGRDPKGSVYGDRANVLLPMRAGGEVRGLHRRRRRVRQAGRCGRCPGRADRGDDRFGPHGREAGVKNDRICDLIVDGLFTCMTNVNFDGQAVTALKDAVRVETVAVAAAAGIEPVSDYDVDQIWGDDEDIRSLKSLVLFGLRGTAAYAYHARVAGLPRRDCRRVLRRRPGAAGRAGLGGRASAPGAEGGRGEPRLHEAAR